jgi:hypothetical protein
MNLDEAGQKRLNEARDCYRDLASRMRAFALSKRFITRLVALTGYEALEISSKLLAVSNSIETYGGGRHRAWQDLEQAIRFQTAT